MKKTTEALYTLLGALLLVYGFIYLSLSGLNSVRNDKPGFIAIGLGMVFVIRRITLGRQEKNKK